MAKINTTMRQVSRIYAYSDKSKNIIKEIMRKYDFGEYKTFSQLVQDLMKERHLKPRDVYLPINMDKRMFSQIKNHKDYHPSKKTVFLLILALKLNYAEAVSLLRSASYAFSESDKTDIAVSTFIEHGIYDIVAINEHLISVGEKELEFSVK